MVMIIIYIKTPNMKHKINHNFSRIFLFILLGNCFSYIFQQTISKLNKSYNLSYLENMWYTWYSVIKLKFVHLG